MCEYSKFLKGLTGMLKQKKTIFRPSAVNFWYSNLNYPCLLFNLLKKRVFFPQKPNKLSKEGLNMKKFTISITTTAAVLTLAACGGGENNGENAGNDPAAENNQTEEVTEEPEADLAEDNEENNSMEADNNDMDTEDNLNTDNNEMNTEADNTEEDEETEAVLDQDIEDFNLDVTLVDDSQWNFSYTPAEDEDGQPEGTVSGEDLELEGEDGAEEMETYLSDFNIDGASDNQEILTEVADTFDFSEEEISSYDLTVDFPEQDNPIEWSWSEDEENGEGNDEA
jgi:hypothetical protein